MNITINIPSFDSFKQRPGFVFKKEYLKEVDRVLDGKHLILMFDEFERM